ncbi:uncharacterized protein SRS1_13613 [Sporisorium reilianum f. sp. reilianum]|uniref:Uncharacterized protein n=1 Tax=Sporisorium reilianum f. sp. reilianum TaxID=72559 RepID=A0A2N8UP13_9BASI|nr:uncharacterized protein SRS1_13613 [Sporisorium reilianum f. sp. reilianum]
MNKRLDELKSKLVDASAAGQVTNPPQWLNELLQSVPSLPADAVPHNRPQHAQLQGKIAAASFHSAIEACLHLINFWFVPASNGGRGSKKDTESLNLDACDDLPHNLQLTAHGHTDLVFLTSLAAKAASSNGNSDDWIKGEIERHYSTTTLAEDKIKLSQSAFDLNDLLLLYHRLAQPDGIQNTVRCLTQLELVWMLGAMVEDFGWREYTMADTVEALRVESTPAHQSVDETRKNKASNMVLNPGQGQRKF